MKMIAGSRYTFKKTEDPKAEDYLQAALGAEKYIRQFEHTEDGQGIYWKKKGATWSEVPEQEIDLSFYSGNTGILYFYLKLYEVTGKEEFLEKIKAICFHMIRKWRKRSIS